MAQVPKYLDSLEDVPASGPDPYSYKAKARAVRYAEAQLEADINDGNEFTEAEIEDIHKEAVSHLASYRLALDPKAPDAATMGDLADEGAGRMEYANRLLELYERSISAIGTATGDAGEGGSVDEEGEYHPPTVLGGGHVFVNGSRDKKP